MPLKLHDLPPGSLELELTESALIDAASARLGIPDRG